MKREVLDQSAGGMWAWLFQRITAVVVFVTIAIHLAATHIFAIGDLSDANIADRLASAFFVVVDLSLLAAVLFHALNGARMVVLDYWFSEKGPRRALAIVLWVIGVVIFVYGSWALWPWITR
jgi:succinate dehydrogenase cytochrome b556 subunit